MAGAQGVDANDYRAAAGRGAEKLAVAVLLQFSALGTVLAFVLLEQSNPAWGRPVISFAGWLLLSEPLYGMLLIGFILTGVGFAIAALMAYRFFRNVSGDSPDEQLIVRSANRIIFIVFLLDMGGLLMFMFMSKGAAGLLSLFLTIVAVITVFTAPCDSILEPCRHCERARNVNSRGLGRILCGFLWLVRPLWIFRPSGWCHSIAFVGLVAYYLGIKLSASVAALAANGHYAGYLAPGSVGVSLEPRTMIAFALMGTLQFLFAKYAREVGLGQ